MSRSEVYNHIGWKVIKTVNDKYSLYYERNVIGEDGALIRISEEVFKEAKDPNCNLPDLFKKYELEKSKVLLTQGHPIKLKSYKNTKNKFFGNGYIVENIEGKYYLRYQLARHGGGSRKFEINKKIYLYARNSEIGTTDLFKKFDLYKYDIPENDEK